MSISVRIGGTWRNVTALPVRVGGTWRTTTEGWVKVGGTWRRFFGEDVVTLSDVNVFSIASGLTPAIASYSLNNDGTITATNILGSNWLVPGTNAGNYTVFAQLISGTPPTTGIINATQSLSTTRGWSNIAYYAGPLVSNSVFSQLSLTINRVSPPAASVASATITLTAQNTGFL